MSEIRDKITNLKQFMESRILGQEELVRKLIITMLADGHALVEGAPGLAKTKAIKTLSECVDAVYRRIQFTPDLLPSDITGSDIYVTSTGQFEFRKGPIFANLILAEEINRAPAKVQTTADSVAQFKSKFGIIQAEDVFAARQEAYKIHCSDAVEEYLIQLIMATRHPEKYDESLKNTIAFGASPRATIALDKCAKINAWLSGRDFVTPEDIHAVVYDVLRHRIILSFEAQAGGLTSDDIITRLLKIVPLP